MSKLPKMSQGRWKRAFQSLNISVKGTEVPLQYAFDCCQSLHPWSNEPCDILLTCSDYDLGICLRKLAECYLCVAHQSHSKHQGDPDCLSPSSLLSQQGRLFADILSSRHQVFQAQSYRTMEGTSLIQQSQLFQ